MNNAPRFPIGHQFMTRGRFPRLCTITDILRTFNSRDELVSVRYVATHEFAGQVVTNRDVVDATVAMGTEALRSANERGRA